MSKAQGGKNDIDGLLLMLKAAGSLVLQGVKFGDIAEGCDWSENTEPWPITEFRKEMGLTPGRGTSLNELGQQVAAPVETDQALSGCLGHLRCGDPWPL
jgi:hypothetical protein